MTRVSVVLYYWVFIIFVLLAAKLFGFAEDGRTMVYSIGIATLFYIGVSMIYATSQRAAKRTKDQEENKKRRQKETFAARYDAIEQKRKKTKAKKRLK